MVKIDISEFTPATLKDEDQYEGPNADENVVKGMFSAHSLSHIILFALNKGPHHSAARRYGSQMGSHPWSDSLGHFNQD